MLHKTTTLYNLTYGETERDLVSHTFGIQRYSEYPNKRRLLVVCKFVNDTSNKHCMKRRVFMHLSGENRKSTQTGVLRSHPFLKLLKYSTLTNLIRTNSW